jgi:uncharacterized protein YndB with AHSA1/START domain
VTEDTNALALEHVFPAPRETVFRAWTEPERLKAWMLRGQCAEVEMDARAGGTYRFKAQMPYGLATAFGSIREINAPDRLVFTFSWEQMPIGETVITIDLKDLGERTEMHFTQDSFLDEGMAAMHAEIWPKDFALLDAVLRGTPAS